MRRRAVSLIALVLAAAALVACSAGAGDGTGRGSLTPSSHPAPPSPSSSAETTRISASPPPSEPPPPPQLLTRDGLWWGVDSTVPISDASLDNVRQWYRHVEHPLVWGRYVSGRYAVTGDELGYARRHGIYVYLLVPDSNCSQCSGGGDLCGNDRTAGQAQEDAEEAVRAAERLHVPAGAMLIKDVEQVGSCTGELTAGYLRGWFDTVQPTPYRVGFYGNAYRQSYDFVRAYCAAIDAEPEIGQAVLADDEPEPAIGAPPHTIGPRNAPPFRPDAPHCAAPGVTRIWQYGESLDDANATDVDEVLPGTPGLLAPDGSVTG